MPYPPFLCEDPIEEFLCKRVEVMTDWDLIAYLRHAMEALYGIALVAEGRLEPGVMQRLGDTYGQADRGRIVKWVVWKYFCRDSANPGQYVTFTSFARGRRWWTDLMFTEMQRQIQRELNTVAPTPSTLVTSAKFLR